MIPDFIRRLLGNFDDALLRAEGQAPIIHEDPDELGYRMLRDNGAITPSIFRGTVATEETQEILCEIMPEVQWLEIEVNAHTQYETGLDNYAE